MAKFDPLQGMTLEKILIALHAKYGWRVLGDRIDIRCFNFDPSIKSSLKFLRKTPWARDKVEQMYVEMVTADPSLLKQEIVTEKKETPKETPKEVDRSRFKF